MLTIYKKIEKSKDNLDGIVEVKSVQDLDRPFLLCISAQDVVDKSIYGIIREGAQAARIHTTQENAAGFKIDEFPVDFLGLRFQSDDVYRHNYEELVDSFLFPFLIGDGTRSVDEIKRIARRINIMTYCDGTFTYAKAEERLEGKLREAGISEEDVKDILSQLSLVALGTMINTSGLNATTATFIDVNDDEIATEKTAYYTNLLQSRNQRSLFGTLKRRNNTIYLYDGTGRHSLKEYLADGVMVKPAICGVLSMFLERSIANEKSDTLVRLSSDDTLAQLRVYGNEKIEPSVLLEQLDGNLTYDGAPRYSPQEAELRQELDVAYKDFKATMRTLEFTENEKRRSEENVRAMMSGIKKYTSDTTYYQILISSCGWQVANPERYLAEKSDREIRELYEALNLEEISMEQDQTSGPKM